ncbi:MAG: sulfotransferase [Gammaproteobacteria bacterium]
MTATATGNVTLTVESEVARIRALVKQRRFAAAAAAAAALLTRVPENRDVLYLLALGQRQLTRTTDALATLGQLERFHPGYSRLYQERGYCYVAAKNAPQAIQEFLRAVTINPALPASWNMLEGLYRMCGDVNNAGMAAAHVAKLKALPPQVITATGLFSDGELLAAEKMIRPFLLAHGNHIEAMRLLARIGAAREVFDDAELLLQAVLERVPDYGAARHDYASVLLGRHKHRQALAEIDKLLAVDPCNRQYRTLHATATVGLGDHAQAIASYKDLLRDAAPGSPNAAELHLSMAHSLKTLGRQPEAINEYRAAARERADFGDAYWSLANLKTYRFDGAEFEFMRGAEAAPATAPVDRYHLCFALGKAYEDRAEYAESWKYYERGNALKRAESRYRPELIEWNTTNQKKVCTREFFERRMGFGVASTAPIFVVGLPRSGSTLIEQVLASHSLVEGTQELADVPRFVLELQGRDPDFVSPRYPGVLAQLPAEEYLRFGEKYLTDTHVYRTGKPRFVDKMPNNFRHIGFIHLMFPNAKIIDARREPMACCFGNLKQLFARGQEFSYSVEDIARYYRTYLELMEHWDAALPGRVLRVHHEDVIDDLEGSVQRILDFCELPFEPACVEFHRTQRSILSASSEQVRQPIFREGLDQWRHYQAWLGPLRETLGDALVRYRR